MNIENEEFNKFESGIYRSPAYHGPIAQDAKIGIKFGNDIFLSKSFMDQHKISYEENDLEDTLIFGKALRIKKEA